MSVPANSHQVSRAKALKGLIKISERFERLGAYLCTNVFHTTARRK
jgi:hypothetical protein